MDDRLAQAAVFLGLKPADYRTRRALWNAVCARIHHLDPLFLPTDPRAAWSVIRRMTGGR